VRVGEVAGDEDDLRPVLLQQVERDLHVLGPIGSFFTFPVW
jgi:hypothetical protein